MSRYYNRNKKVKIRMKIEYIWTKQTDIDKHRVTLLLIIKKQSIILKSKQNFIEMYVVATLSTFYQTVSGIIIMSIKSIGQV